MQKRNLGKSNLEVFDLSWLEERERVSHSDPGFRIGGYVNFSTSESSTNRQILAATK
jgi:hypothetical protein